MYNIRPIPPSDLKRVQKAIGLVRKVAESPKDFSSCHKFFKRNCRGRRTLAQTFKAAKLWKITDPNSFVRNQDKTRPKLQGTLSFILNILTHPNVLKSLK